MHWYTSVKRWGQTNLTERDPATMDLSFWRAYWKKMHIGGVIVNAGGIVAYYPSAYPLHHRAKTLGDGDLFGDFVRAAREEGLAVVARMDSNRADPDFYRAHPDWFCVDSSGKPYESQGRYFTCVNSDYYKTYIPDVLREIIARYHPDGFTDNSWSGIRRDKICYCDTCRRLFREESGLELPERVEPSNPVYQIYLAWSYRCREANWRLFNDVTRGAGGEDCIWVGMINADPADLGGHYVDLRSICRQTPILFNDHQCRNALDGFEQNYVNGALLHELAGDDTLIPESMAHYVTGDRTFRLSAAPAAEVRTWAACGYAGGISPWYHHVSGGTDDRRQFSTTADMMAWHERCEDALYGRENLADVALVWSRDNCDLYDAAQRRERVSLPWRGFTAALAAARLPFTAVHLDDLREKMHRFRVLILPDIAAMSDAQIETVCDFLRGGGSVVLTGQTGLLDERGQRRSGSELWACLGLSIKEKKQATDNRGRGDWENDTHHTYLWRTHEAHPLWKGFEETSIIGFGGEMTGVTSDGLLERLGGLLPAFPIYPPEMSARPEPVFDEAPILAGELPWGGRTVYLAADIDRCYGRDRLPDHGRLLANAVQWARNAEPPVRVEGAGHLLVSAYRQDEKKIVHVVNMSGMSAKPGYLAECLPVHDLRVQLPGARGTWHVRALVSGLETEVTCDREGAAMTLKRVEQHEVLVFEPAETIKE